MESNNIATPVEITEFFQGAEMDQQMRCNDKTDRLKEMATELLTLRQLVTSYRLGEFVSRRLIYNADVARNLRFNLDNKGNILIYNDVLEDLGLESINAFRLFNFGETAFRVFFHSLMVNNTAVQQSRTNIALREHVRTDTGTSPIHFPGENLAVAAPIEPMEEGAVGGEPSVDVLADHFKQYLSLMDKEPVISFDEFQESIPQPKTTFHGPLMVTRHYDRRHNALPVVYNQGNRRDYIDRARVKIGNRGAFVESNLGDPSLINLLSLQRPLDTNAATNTRTHPTITDELGRTFNLVPCPLPYSGMYDEGTPLYEAPHHIDMTALKLLSSRYIPSLNVLTNRNTGVQFLATRFIEVRDNWAQQPTNLQAETTSLREFRRMRQEFLDMSDTRNGERGIHVVRLNPPPGERSDYWLTLPRPTGQLEQNFQRMRRGLTSLYGSILADLNYINGGRPDYYACTHWQDALYDIFMRGSGPISYLRKLNLRFTVSEDLRPAANGILGPPDDFWVCRPHVYQAFSGTDMPRRSNGGTWLGEHRLRRADSFENMSRGGGRHQQSVRDAGRAATQYFGCQYEEHSSPLHFCETIRGEGHPGILKLDIRDAVDIYYRVWAFRIACMPNPHANTRIQNSPLLTLPQVLPLQSQQVDEWQQFIIGRIADTVQLPQDALKEEAERILAETI